MNQRTFNVLFLCTGNSARSILAEGLLNALGGDQFKAHSAGSHPTGAVNPRALTALATLGVPMTGFPSKSWDEFASQDAPVLDFIFTVCDKAAGELCPVWPGQPITAHWGVPDPAITQGSEQHQQRMFADTAITLKRRIDLLLLLPIVSLDEMSLRFHLKDIGTR